MEGDGYKMDGSQNKTPPLTEGKGASVTISDVAAHAGVSIKTVSRVLNGEPNVRPDKRARVTAAVEALSYRPNASARSLAAGRSFLIGMFYENPNIHYVGSLQHGALTRCSRLGYHLVVEECETASPEGARRVGELARATRLDGAILSPPVSDCPHILQALQAAGVPMVRIAPLTDTDSVPTVAIDDRQAAVDLTNHVIGLGHRRIAFIAGDPAHRASIDREAGFRAAMRAAGLPLADGMVQGADFSFTTGRTAAERLLTMAVRPTAIFAANDDMAAAVYATATRLGLSIPRDLSVVGFDDTPMASCLWPQLTTVAQPIAEIAENAVDLIARVKARTLQRADMHVRLGYRLVLRNSTAPPAMGR
ncbi:MAG: hypothetical protein RLY86_2264 [Pseudomonadota bacterium]|jgi:LacI family transcriptional regulator